MTATAPLSLSGPDSTSPATARRRASIHWARLLAPRARDPPELVAEWAGTPEFAFDQSPPWDPTSPAPDPGLPFDQTLN